MEVLSTILYILLFLLFLSVLIVVHELGHLAAAKAFNVYCLEYSVGMGPLLLKKKRKNGETQFSLRAIPFGGYVSMYGEGVELPEGVEIPESRSLNGIKWWKRCIILIAGVTMNAILALVFFFISNCLPQQTLSYVDQIAVADGSAAYAAGLRNEDVIKYEEWQYYDDAANTQFTYYVADNQTTFNNDDSVKYATCFELSSLSSFKHLDLAEFTYIYQTEKTQDFSGDYYEVKYTNGNTFRFAIKTHIDAEEPKVSYLVDNNNQRFFVLEDINTHIIDIYSNDKVSVLSVTKLAKDETLMPVFDDKAINPDFENATLHITKLVTDDNGKFVDGDIATFDIKQKNNVIESFGMSLYSYTTRMNGGQAFKQTFKDFGTSSVTLIRAIGDLFTKPKTWENVGGIVAVGFQTSAVLENFGFARFLYVWAFISVNLAIFNLLPFPGLDGWQLLVTVVETTTRKKVPEKVKNIVSFIGIALLLVLMAVILFKDLGTYVFGMIAL